MASNGKSEYRTFDKFLSDKGLVKKNLSKPDLQKYHSEYLNSKPWLKNYLNNTNGNGQEKIVNSENNSNSTGQKSAFSQQDNIKPSIPFNRNHIKQIIAFDKVREELKRGEKKVDPEKKIEYHQFDNKKDTNNQEKGAEPEKELSEEEKAKKKFDQDWAWMDGNTVIHFLDQFNLFITPKLCDRFNKVCPTPEQIVYKENAKKMMKPGMDQVAEEIKKMFQNPLYLAIGVALYQPFMLVATAKPIPVYNGFEQHDKQDPILPST